MSDRDHVLDLSARARRGEATDEELKRLRAALASSATLRTAHQMGADFDAALAVQAGDSALIDQVVKRALLQRGKPGRSRHLRASRTRWLALAAALSCSAGALAWWQVGTSTVAPPARSATLPVIPSSPPTLRASRSAASPSPSHSATPSLLPPAPREPAPAAASPSSAAEPSAEALFARANQARRAGRDVEAIELYRRLQRAHPASAEALTSRIALGRLLIAKGEHAQALVELDRHLLAGGALAEEALLWKARVLRQMGDSDNERKTLRELLSRFPSTAYEYEAKSRLDQVTATAGD